LPRWRARAEKIDTDEMPEVRDWTDAKRGVFCRPVKASAEYIDWRRRMSRANL
jgi:hypothetical protein